MNPRQMAYRLLWRARNIAADDITQFALVGSLSGWMGTIWETFNAAERDAVFKAGPATAQEVNGGSEQQEQEQAAGAGGGGEHEAPPAGARGGAPPQSRGDEPASS